ncbi:glycerophosphoryl diester phosphodiesterase membrane domain-containing protein [Paenibacillus sp. MBLB4367]|uniref:glycerophosphoryl diester phosphodiesterase membrane domain-containing protein n=1 Tax=Paenibacillus sp. MBLB4367 TaxID=3384767 RepID=UPI00390802D3
MHRKSPFLKLVADAFRTMSFTFREVMLFELFYKALTFFIFIPTISVVFHKLLSLGGFAGATNYELLRFFMSKYGLLCLALLVPAATVLIFVEFAVLIVISYLGHHRVRTNLPRAFLQAVSCLPALFTFGFVGWALYFLLVIPLLSPGLGSSLLPSLTIPNFISGELYKTGSGTLLYLGFLAVLLFFNIRWTFSLHALVIEGIGGFRQAAKQSAAIMRKSYVKMTAVVASTLLVFILVVVLATIALLFALTFAHAFLAGDTGTGGFVRSVLAKSFIVSTYAATVLVTPLYVTTLTRLYIEKAEPRRFVLQPLEWRSAGDSAPPIRRMFRPHRRKLFVFLALIAFATGLVLAPAIGGSAFKDHDFVVMAHRGYTAKGAENTLEAIRGAIDAGADYAEIDIQETKDGKLAVMHDTNLKRLTGRNADLSELTMDELRQLEVKQGRFTGRISTLQEVMELAKGRIKLNIELKTHGRERDLAGIFVRAIRDYDFAGDCIVQSLNTDVIRQVKTLEPSLKVGYVLFAGTPKWERMGADFFTMEEYRVSEPVIAAAKALNKPIYVWTVNDAAAMERFFRMGADGVVTDNPEQALLVADGVRASEDPFFDALFDWLDRL